MSSDICGLVWQRQHVVTGTHWELTNRRRRAHWENHESFKSLLPVNWTTSSNKAAPLNPSQQFHRLGMKYSNFWVQGFTLSLISTLDYRNIVSWLPLKTSLGIRVSLSYGPYIQELYEYLLSEVWKVIF